MGKKKNGGGGKTKDKEPDMTIESAKTRHLRKGQKEPHVKRGCPIEKGRFGRRGQIRGESKNKKRKTILLEEGKMARTLPEQLRSLRGKAKLRAKRKNWPIEKPT